MLPPPSPPSPPPQSLDFPIGLILSCMGLFVLTPLLILTVPILYEMRNGMVTRVTVSARQTSAYQKHDEGASERSPPMREMEVAVQAAD